MTQYKPSVDLNPIDQYVEGSPWDHINDWCSPKVKMVEDEAGEYVKLSDALNLIRYYKNLYKEADGKK